MMAAKKTGTENTYAKAAREREAEERKWWALISSVASKAHQESFRDAKSGVDEPWFIFYRVGGLAIRHESPGAGWTKGPRINVGSLTREQVVIRLNDAARTLPVLPLP